MSKQKCESCGVLFLPMPRKGMHHPKECPEGLDLECPSCDPEVYEVHCKNCRVKQDGQRS